MSNTAIFHPLETLSRRPVPIPLVARQTNEFNAVKKVDMPANMYRVNVQRNIEPTFHRDDVLDKLKQSSGWVLSCDNPQTFALDKPYVNQTTSLSTESSKSDDDETKETQKSDKTKETESIDNLSDEDDSTTIKSVTSDSDEEDDEDEEDQGPILYKFTTMPMSTLCVDDTVFVVCSG